VLELRAEGACPLRVSINGELEYFGTLVGSNLFMKHLPLTEPISIHMAVDRQHPQAVEIVKLTIDGYEILPLYLSQATPPTNYLDFTGIWTLEIPNFYPWYHAITGQGWIA
jgi:hypothetical protein